MVDDWFARCHTLEEARLEYRRLCFTYHPDHGGSTELMQQINAAYARFRRDFALRQARRAPRRGWQPPPRVRPDDLPPDDTRVPPVAPAVPERSACEAIRRQWQATPWQALADGSLRRVLLGHSLILLRYTPARATPAWCVVFDQRFSPYVYMTRDEAEQAAFELLCQAVGRDRA